MFGVTNLSVIKAAAEPSVVGYIDGSHDPEQLSGPYDRDREHKQREDQA